MLRFTKKKTLILIGLTYSIIGKMLVPGDGTLNNQPHIYIYTLNSGYLLDISPLKGLLGVVNS